MGRRPLDRIGQRQLAQELKHAIDQGGKRGLRLVDQLIAENPRSWRSTHVLYNLGARRRVWLEAYWHRLPFLPDASTRFTGRR